MAHYTYLNHLGIGKRITMTNSLFFISVIKVAIQPNTSAKGKARVRVKKAL